MSVIYATAAKTARMNAVVTDIGGTGVLEIGTAGMALVLATFPLNATAGTVSGSTLTFSGFPKTDAADATGTAAAARIRKAVAGTDVITGLTVGLSAADIIVDSTSLTVGQQFQINSATITHAA